MTRLLSAAGRGIAAGSLLACCVGCRPTKAPRPRLTKPPASVATEDTDPEDSLSAPPPPDPKRSPTRVALTGARAAEASLQADARSGLVGVVVGMRERQTECERLVELRVIDEVYLTGSLPHGTSEVPDHETRALLSLPLGARSSTGEAPSGCRKRHSTSFGLTQVAAGDRVALSLTSAQLSPASDAEPYPWQRYPRVLAIADLDRLPTLMRSLPLPRHDAEGEQDELLPWLPLPGTPESARQLGKGARFEVRGPEILDHAQGITWQREALAAPLHLFQAGWACEAASTAGHRDWRLPTARELQTLFLDPSVKAVTGPRWLRPDLFGNATHSVWWTRTDDDGFYVGLAGTGEVASTHYDSPGPYGPYRVRCVRDSSQRRSVALSQFRADTNLLHDPISGLVWLLPDGPHQRTQDLARRRCESRRAGGHSDWRLPNQSEALSLMSRCPAPLYDWSEANDVRRVWLAGPSPDGKYALGVRMCDYAATPIGVLDSSQSKAHALCVRSEPLEAPARDIECPAGSTRHGSPERVECRAGALREGPFVSFYPSGAVFERGAFHRDARDGPFATYHEQGGVWVSGHFSAGRLDGEVIAQRPSGERRTIQRFQDGAPSGTWHFYAPGQREVEWIQMKHGAPARGRLSLREEGGDIRVVPTRRGLPHGIEEFRAADSDYVRRSVVVLGQPEGDYEVLQDGEVSQRGTKEEGLEEGLWVRILEEGEERAMFSRGRLDGPFLVLDGLGEVLRRREYRRGRPWGKWQLEDEQGRVIQRCDLDPQGTGRFTVYDGEGRKQRVEPYRAGLLDGTLETYSDGKLVSQATYRAGVLEGRTRRYLETGKPAGFETYRAGRREGPAEDRYATGDLRERGSYADGQRTGGWLFVLPSGARFEVRFSAGRAVGGTWD